MRDDDRPGEYRKRERMVEITFVRGDFISPAPAHFQSNSVVVAVTRVVRQAPSVHTPVRVK